MNERNPDLLPELERALEQYHTLPAPRAEFASHLEAQLRRQVQQTRRRQPFAERNSLMKLVQTRPLAAILLALLALLILSGVAYAVGRAAGYIPGLGLVDQSSPLRILAEPVRMEKGGLTVRVTDVIVDSDHTLVAYAIDGLFWGQSLCGELPSLHLLDGTLWRVTNGGEGPRGGRVGDPMNFQTTVYYPAIPLGVDQAALEFPCILTEGTGPGHWQIPLKLAAAPKDFATPVVEIGPTFIASNPTFANTPLPTREIAVPTEAAPSSSAGTLTSIPNGSGLYLEKVVELPGSYILVGNFTDAGDLPGGLVVNDDPQADLPRIEDGLGNPVPFKVRQDIQHDSGWSDRYWVRPWAYEIAKPVQGPLTITLDQIDIAVSETASFGFDAGSNPQMGQKWELNLPIHLRAYDYRMDSVERIEAGYLFKYHSGTDVPQGSSLLFNIVGSTPDHDDSTLRARETIVEYSDRLTYSGPPPSGQITVQLTFTETVPLKGPWKLTWTPPSR